MAQAYYPMFADLRGRRCLIVGGGLIAQRKATTLLSYGAQVTVVSPDATSRLKRYAGERRIRYVARRFRPADLRGVWLVCAATDEATVNAQVYREATRRRIFTNVVDQKPLCSFIAPAIARRGGLTVAVSTGGASPSVAQQIRDRVDRAIGAEYAPMLRLLEGLRGAAKRTLPTYQDRKRYFDGLVCGRVFRLVKANRMAAARRMALQQLRRQASGANPSARTAAFARGLAQDSAPRALPAGLRGH